MKQFDGVKTTKKKIPMEKSNLMAEVIIKIQVNDEERRRGEEAARWLLLPFFIH